METPNSILALKSEPYTPPAKKSLMERFGNAQGAKKFRFRQEPSPATTLQSPAHSVPGTMTPSNVGEDEVPSLETPILETPLLETPQPPSQPNFVEPRVASALSFIQRFHMSDINRSILTAQKLKDVNNALYLKFNIPLEIDICLLLDHDVELGTLLLDGDVQVKVCFALAALKLLRDLFHPVVIHEELVLLHVRVTQLPQLESYTMNLENVFDFTRLSKSQRLFVTYARVETMYAPTFTNTGQVFLCVNSNCRNKNYLHVNPTSQSNNVTKRDEDGQHLKLSTKRSLHALDKTCSHCNMKMEEMVTDRSFATYQNLRLTGVNVDGGFKKTVMANVDDDLVNTVKVGDLVQVVASFSRRLVKKNVKEYDNGVILHVNFIKPVEMILPSLPVSIETLLQRQLSPWAFIQRLVDCFCRHVVPHKVWRRSKLIMLLSLVSIGNQISKDETSDALNVFFKMAAWDSRFSKLVEEASVMYPRNSRWACVRDGKKREPLTHIGTEMVGRGAISDAVGGIFVVNADTLIKRDVVELESALDFPKPHGDIPYSQESCVWMIGKDGKLFNVLESKFSLRLTIFPSASASMTDVETGETLLLMAMNLSPDYKRPLPVYPNISQSDFQDYIKICKNVQVKMGEECNQLLQDYFLTLRKMNSRFQLFQGHESMFGMMETMVKLSMASAKLCLRRVTLADDAVLAILIMEETSGLSLLQFTTLPDDEFNLHRLFSAREQAIVLNDQGQSIGPDDFTRQVMKDDEEISAFYEAICGSMGSYETVDE